ncbi:MAG: hypothetical protein ABJA80_13475 [bacterium]
MNEETRTRFLSAIARQVPADRVIEVHLFGAIRQGGMESGVAVIALERASAARPEPSLDVDGGYVPAAAVAQAAELESHAAIAVIDELSDEAAFVADEAVEPSPYSDGHPEPPVCHPEPSVCHPERSEGSASPDAASASDADGRRDVMDDLDAGNDERPVLDIAPASRYTVYSARYRYTLKGIDRGKWDVSVTEEADAPLLTVDAVVRGVQRRSGDADEVERLSGDEFRATLPTAQPAA